MNKILNILCIFIFPSLEPCIAQTMIWDSLYSVVNTLYDKKKYDEAYPIATQNLLIAETTFGIKDIRYHQTIFQLGQILYFKKDYNKGIDYLSNSSQILSTTPFKDSVYHGKLLNLLGLMYKKNNKYENAEKAYLTGYSILKLLYKNYPKEYSTCISNLAILYFEQGRTDESIDFNTQALALTPKNSDAYNIRLGVLSLLYKRKGRFKEALFMAQEALDNTDSTNAIYPARLIALSSLYADIGLLEKALDIAHRALNAKEQSNGRNSAENAQYAYSVSWLNQKLRRYDTALIYAQYALTTEERQRDRPEYYLYQGQVANCYTYLNRVDEALPMLLESVGQLAAKSGKKSEYYLITLNHLINLYKNTSNIEKALKLNEEEIELVKQAWSDIDDRYFAAQMRLIELYNMNGQYAKSTVSLKNLVQKINNQVLYNIDVLEEFSKELFITNFIKDYEPLLFSHIKNNAAYDSDLLKMAFETELAMKGVILSSSQLFKQIANKGSKNPLYASWEQQKEAISKAYMRHTTQRTIDSLNTDLSTIEEKLIASTPELQQIQRKTTSFNDIKNGLKSDACAIEFVRFRYHNNQRWTDSFYYAALIVKPYQDTPDCVFLCEENALKSVMSKYQNAQQLYATRGKLRGKRNENTKGTSRGSQEEATVLPSKTLYNLIWQPLQNHLAGVKTVYYTSAGLLHQVAFAALPIDESNVLNDVYQLNALSSTRKILQKSEPVKISNATLYGGIVYDEKQGVSNNPNAWQYLSGTKKEVSKIAALFTAKNIQNNLNEGTTATETVFKAQNTEGVSPTVLHIATHGFFYQNRIDTLQKEAISFQNAKSSMIRSGLIMAGANKSWLGEQPQEGREDGILTAYEIANLNLSHTQLVVLSACETGLGDAQGSEGVYGLQRAFKMAGVEYILMSLWKVPDKQTAELMEKFYTHWLYGATIEDAFYQAQQSMKANYLPYNWAGFVLMR